MYLSRKNVPLSIGLLAVAVLPCLAEKKKKETKVGYVFPAAMAPAIQAEFRIQCDKGQALYNLSCARCHNQVVGGKSVIPDFSAAQMEAYQLRAGSAAHETEVSEERVPAEELALITTFLKYKVRSGVVVATDSARHAKAELAH